MINGHGMGAHDGTTFMGYRFPITSVFYGSPLVNWAKIKVNSKTMGGPKPKTPMNPTMSSAPWDVPYIFWTGMISECLRESCQVPCHCHDVAIPPSLMSDDRGGCCTVAGAAAAGAVEGGLRLQRCQLPWPAVCRTQEADHQAGDRALRPLRPGPGGASLAIFQAKAFTFVISTIVRRFSNIVFLFDFVWSAIIVRLLWMSGCGLGFLFDELHSNYLL